MNNNSNLILTCQKAYLAAAVESAGDDFLMGFDEIEVLEVVNTTKAFLDLEKDLYSSYTDPIKAFKKPLIDLGLITEEVDEHYISMQHLTDNGIKYLESLNHIEVIYNN